MLYLLILIDFVILLRFSQAVGFAIGAQHLNSE